jgi:hypothetical protein
MKSGILILSISIILGNLAQAQPCTPQGNQTSYGSSNTWIGYVYQGNSFGTYKGYVTEGSSQSPNFSVNFDLDNSKASYATNGCSVISEQMSVRYLLTESLAGGNYSFTLGASGSCRLSLDGGNTWVINNWTNQSNQTGSYAVTLADGNYNLVIEYAQDNGPGSLNFTMSTFVVPPITMASFTSQLQQNGSLLLDWSTIMEEDNNYFAVERSADGVNFQQVVEVPTKQTDTTTTYALQYSYTDPSPLPGTSFYRLQIVDKYGLTNYSKVLQVTTAQIQGIKVYPTVVTSSSLFVETEKPIANARLELFDLTGKKINETDWASLSGRQSCSITGNQRVVTGTYVVLLTAGGTNLLHQLIIVQSN